MGLLHTLVRRRQRIFLGIVISLCVYVISVICTDRHTHTSVYSVVQNSSSRLLISNVIRSNSTPSVTRKPSHWSNIHTQNDWNNNNEQNWTYPATLSLCKNSSDSKMAEDLFCKKRPQLLANYKNPCWEEKGQDGKTRVRCMPYFHLIGADKCGSTDLFDRILRHPDMEPSTCGLNKECYHWCWLRYGIWMKNTTRRMQPFNHYFNHFNKASYTIAQLESHGHHSHITGEGTPMDLWDFRGWKRIPQNKDLDEPKILTPHLMKHVYPNPKFIVILRNPADRLYSDYYFLGYGNSPGKFHNDAISAINMIQTCLLNRTIRQCLYSIDMYHILPMRIHISCYSVFLKEWFAVFPRENFLVLRNEDYGRDIKTTMQQVFDFLNITTPEESEMDTIINPIRKHVTHSKTDKGPMLNETRILLDEFFAPFTHDLADMLQDKRFLWKDLD